MKICVWLHNKSEVYHMCDGLGRQFSYTCPNNTLFQQRMLICDHWYMVNCNKSEGDYAANLLIGQRDKPFVEDSEKHPYKRTPRPDLLNASDYNSVLTNSRSKFTTNYNLVGIETDETTSSTDIKTHYSLPSHWFTSLYKGITTQLPTTQKNKEILFAAKEPKSIQGQQKLNLKVQNAEEGSKSEGTSTPHQNFKHNSKSPELHKNYSNNETETTTTNINEINVDKSVENEQKWKELKRIFLIPDYDFPLDDASRPGYDHDKNSFDASSLL
ncbi:hypothetical protein FQA39_LY06400 [Lamprigera yunnana]|nr:hypothetical protein FQA39_LY06400 [Lamprigera yunnana]